MKCNKCGKQNFLVLPLCDNCLERERDKVCDVTRKQTIDEVLKKLDELIDGNREAEDDYSHEYDIACWNLIGEIKALSEGKR